MAMERVITADNIGITRMLFASGVTIASTEEERDSLLRLAIERKNEEMVKLLVQQGACIHVTDTGRSPLHYARNHKAIQSYLRRVVPQCDHSLGFTLFLTLVAFALVVLHALFATDT
ncbi:hypothetical protein PTSG_10856 [Salpingoeca rosetta]|uniref:Uncharacterized protein n=1 Tax=Salpingoeca rosetta (strain ATCC 50818 / BSB-021) TaxID=946362 RepID=F2URK6_SALR5|nr:uncharacterized protein PTSG_10856 [Salpingoeca rosetta]EGD80175.1 hypothetical protein PTSG_10856 [Salpingoeca rosetta]|eukprot:XP_004988237.1 hypothetical protein PTSG_10856 [Salpingoeca rosetta]